MEQYHCEHDEKTLEDAGIRVTAVRLLIWKTINTQTSGAFSLLDLEKAMSTVDRSTIFRTLTIFAEKKLLHTVDDGSGMQKYCVCHCSDEEHHGHIHLTCTICHETFCLEKVKIPTVPIPKGWSIQESEYVIKGICPKCGNNIS